MKEDIKNWFHKLQPRHKSLLEELRTLILSSAESIKEEIKWNRPCYSICGLVCYLHSAEKHVTLGFQQGSHLADPDEFLEGEGKDMRHIKILVDEKINKPVLKRLIKAAVAYDEVNFNE